MYLRECLRTEIAKVKEEMYYELDRLDTKFEKSLRRFDSRLSHLETIMDVIIGPGLTGLHGNLGNVAMDDPSVASEPQVKSFVIGSELPFSPPNFCNRSNRVDEVNIIYLQNGIHLDGLHVKERDMAVGREVVLQHGADLQEVDSMVGSMESGE